MLGEKLSNEKYVWLVLSMEPEDREQGEWRQGLLLFITGDGVTIYDGGL